MTTEVGGAHVESDAEGVDLTPEQISAFAELFKVEESEARRGMEPFLVTDPEHVALLEHTANLLDAHFSDYGLEELEWRADPEIVLLRPERHSETGEPIKVSLSVPDPRRGGMREFHDAWKLGAGVWVAEWHKRRDTVDPPREGTFHSPSESFWLAVEEIRDGLIESSVGHIATEAGAEIVPYEGFEGAPVDNQVNVPPQELQLAS